MTVTMKAALIQNVTLVWYVYAQTFRKNLLLPFSGQMEKEGFSETSVYTTAFFQNQVTSEVASSLDVKKGKSVILQARGVQRVPRS